MTPRAERRYHDSVSVVRGPLVYALKVGEDWRLIGGELPHGDWEVHPTTPWNMALVLDPDAVSESVHFEEHAIGHVPFSPERAPVTASACAVPVSGWNVEHGAAGSLPNSPIETDQAQEDVVLIPYGCTNLRIGEFPWAMPDEGA